MARWWHTSIVLLAIAYGAPARADDDAATAALRRDFDALIRRIEHGPQRNGDSPTAIVGRLRSADDKKLRPVLEKAWALARPIGSDGGSHVFSVRPAIRLIYGHVRHSKSEPALDDPFLAEDGVVRFASARGYACGSSNARTEPLPSFETLTGGKELRPLPRLSAQALVEGLGASVKAPVDTMDDFERDDYALAVGEACAADDDARPLLLAKSAEFPRRDDLVTAVAWTRSSEAVAVLRVRLAELARGPVGESEDGRRSLAIVCRGLAHAAPGELAAAIAALPAPDQDAALWASGADVSEPFFLQWIDRAKSASARVDAWKRIRAVLASDASARLRQVYHSGFQHCPPDPSPAVAQRLLRWMAEELESPVPEVRVAVTAAADPLLRFDPHMYVGGSDEVELLSCYPSAEHLLQAFGPAFAFERTSFVDAARSAFSEPTPQKPDAESRVRTAIRVVDARGRHRALLPWIEMDELNTGFVMVNDGPPPAHDLALEGTVAPEGLRVRMTNVSGHALLIHRFGLSYSRAELRIDKEYPKDAPRKIVRTLHILLGQYPQRLRVRAGALAPLADGETYEWVLPLREQDRDVDHIAVSLLDWAEIEGVPRAPRVRRFDTAWVR